MDHEQQPDTPQSEDDILEAQLVSYARDLQDLFLEYKGLEASSSQAQELFQFRTHEVSALNDFLRKRIAEQVELETAYETLLDNLDRILYRIQPTPTREVVQEWIWEGRQDLQRIRERRRAV